MNIADRWLDEYIMCGWHYPITRRRALREMIDKGWDTSEAMKCLCYYKAIAAPQVSAKAISGNAVEDPHKPCATSSYGSVDAA